MILVPGLNEHGGFTAFKDCFILRSLEGVSSAPALDRSIAQLLTSDGREFARITLDSNDDQAPAGSRIFNPGISGTGFCKIPGSRDFSGRD